MAAGGEAGVSRKAAQAAVICMGAATVALPPLLGAKGAVSTTALLAFGIIFNNIMTGSMGLPFYRLFGPKPVRRYHIATGATGFTLALVHGIVVLSTRSLAGYNKAWIIGPVVLVLLVATIAAAMSRKKLKHVWRRIHQVNYAIFVAIVVKAVLVGSDLMSKLDLRIVFYVYTAWKAAM